jgi:hypothetical protein
MDLEYLIPNPHFGQSAIERPEKIRVKIVSFLTPERVQVRDVQTGELLEVLYSTLESAPLLRVSTRSPETLGTLGKDVGYRNIAPFLSTRDLSSLTLTSRSLSDEFRAPLNDMKQKLCAFLDSPLLKFLFEGERGKERPTTFREYMREILVYGLSFPRSFSKKSYGLPKPKTLLFQYCYSGIIPCKKFNSIEDATASGFRPRGITRNLKRIEPYGGNGLQGPTDEGFVFPYTGAYYTVFEPESFFYSDDGELEIPEFFNAEGLVRPELRAIVKQVFVIDASVFVDSGIGPEQYNFSTFLCEYYNKLLINLAMSNCSNLEGGKTYYSL